MNVTNRRLELGAEMVLDGSASAMLRQTMLVGNTVIIGTGKTGTPSQVDHMSTLEDDDGTDMLDS